MGIFLNVRTLLLQALLRNEGYGLQLAERVAEMTNGEARIGPGRLYPELRAMEADGLVTSREGAPSAERGGRSRIFYKLTAKGKHAAVEQRATSAAVFGLLAPGAVR